MINRFLAAFTHTWLNHFYVSCEGGVLVNTGRFCALLTYDFDDKIDIRNEENRAISPETKKNSCSCYSWNLWYVNVSSAPSNLFGQKKEEETGEKNRSVFLKSKLFRNFLFNQLGGVQSKCSIK